MSPPKEEQYRCGKIFTTVHPDLESLERDPRAGSTQTATKPLQRVWPGRSLRVVSLCVLTPVSMVTMGQLVLPHLRLKPGQTATRPPFKLWVLEVGLRANSVTESLCNQ